jgi:hypothetical protein
MLPNFWMPCKRLSCGFVFPLHYPATTRQMELMSLYFFDILYIATKGWCPHQRVGKRISY